MTSQPQQGIVTVRNVEGMKSGDGWVVDYFSLSSSRSLYVLYVVVRVIGRSRSWQIVVIDDSRFGFPCC